MAEKYRYSLSGVQYKYSFSIVENKSSVVMMEGMISTYLLSQARKIVKKVIKMFEEMYGGN